MDLVDVSRHVPWIVFEAKDWLDTYLDTGMRVLEWGSGGSTVYFCRTATEVVSIEHNPEWFAEVARALEALALTNCSYHLIEPRGTQFMRFAPYDAAFYNSQTFVEYKPYSFKNYVRKCLEYPDEYFDFIFVDGRARASCMRRAMSKLRRNGVLMLDNSERVQYQKEMARLRHLKRRDFFGNGPFADELWQTTIWFKE